MSDVLAASYLWLKAVHVAAVIFWMAGMLYLPRLFVYHYTASPGGELSETLKRQEERLLRVIMLPASVAVWVLGLLMLWARPDFLSQGWLHVKLALVIALTVMHHYLGVARKAFARDERPRTERFWRMINEVPALAVLVIAVMVVVKPFA